MDSSRSASIKRSVRLAYEWGRALRAVLGFAPILVLVIAASLIGTTPVPTLTFGAMMFIWGALLLWYGRDLRRAVLPGVVAGIVPLTLALCAKYVGHACSGAGCATLCLPACVMGGIVAGGAVAAVGRRGRHGLGFWLAASTTAVLTGAMGCACMGYSGVVGLIVGYTAGALPVAIAALLARRTS